MPFLSIVSLYFSPFLLRWLLHFLSHLQRLWSKIISIENPPSTDSMVQSFNTSVSGLVSARCVACHLSVKRLHPDSSSSSLRSLFLLILHIGVHRAGVSRFNLPKHWSPTKIFLLCPKVFSLCALFFFS